MSLTGRKCLDYPIEESFIDAISFYFFRQISVSVMTEKNELQKNKLETLVEDNPKALFLIATTPRCRKGRYYFPWTAPLYPRYVPYNVEC